MFEFLVDTAKVKVGKKKLCKGCRIRIDISVSDVKHNKVVCTNCGYTNIIVFFLKKAGNPKFPSS